MAALLILSGVGFSVAGEKNWHFGITPTFWASGMDIDSSTVRGREVAADFEFGDIWEHLDFGGSIQFEAWHGQWGILIEELYIDLGFNGMFQPRIGPRVDAELDIRMNLFEMAVVHRFELKGSANPSGSPNDGFRPTLYMEPMAGLRYGTIKEQIDLKLTPSQLTSIGETTGVFEDNEWWIEIFAGGRLNYWFRPYWHFYLGADVGGIQYGDETVFSWKAYTGFDYKPWKSTTLRIGYKIYDFNYKNTADNETFELDAMLHGPTVGVVIWF